MNYIQQLNSFDINSLPDLDVVVLGALELFEQSQLPKMDLSRYKHPLIVGSGNAEATGRIVFHDTDAVYASESNYQEKLANIPSIDGVVLISASGAKHAPIIAQCAGEMGKHVTLITNTDNSPAEEELDGHYDYDEFVFPKNREPYTYNTSTYMGMILGKTQENPTEIRSFIESEIAQIEWPDFSQYQKYYIIVPPQFSGLKRMIQVKFIELFGREIARDVETSEYVRHATTVVSSEGEMFIAFGEANDTWGSPFDRLNVPLPSGADYGAMMAISYYVVGQIQKAYPELFKNNIEHYTSEVSKLFKNPVHPIVEV